MVKTKIMLLALLLLQAQQKYAETSILISETVHFLLST